VPDDRIVPLARDELCRRSRRSRRAPTGERVPRTYVWCRRSGYGELAAHRREDPTWEFRELDTTHMAMYTMPRELADLLLELA
jgi:hypothetical protein